MPEEQKPDPPTPEVKPSPDSGSEKKPEPTLTPKPEIPPTPPPAAGDSGGSSKLAAELAEKLRAEQDRTVKAEERANRAEMRLAQQAAERTRLRRIFKPGFKVAKGR